MLGNFATFAQNGRVVKIYQNTDIVKIYRSEWSDLQQQYIPSEKYEVSFNRVSLAMMWNSPLWMQEIEVSYSSETAPVSWSPRPERRGVFTNTLHFASVQYEIGKHITASHRKIDFVLGAGLTPYWLNFEKEPKTSNAYTATQLHMGSTASANAHAMYKLSKRLLVDFSLKLGLVDFRFYRQQVHNPVIPIRQQVNDTYSFDFLPDAYTIRLGLGYRI
jgi:hypothetical protein